MNHNHHDNHQNKEPKKKKARNSGQKSCATTCVFCISAFKKPAKTVVFWKAKGTGLVVAAIAESRPPSQLLQRNLCLATWGWDISFYFSKHHPNGSGRFSPWKPGVVVAAFYRSFCPCLESMIFRNFPGRYRGGRCFSRISWESILLSSCMVFFAK